MSSPRQIPLAIRQWTTRLIAMCTARRLALIYAIGFFVLIAGSFITWPIVAYDTDLWYHLSGGQYIFEHHAIPRTSYFSFIDPPRIWVDYYWLFQALVYVIHSWTSYYGLIVFRTATYLTTIILIWWYLFKREDTHASPWWILALFVVECLILLPRSLNVRPHMFTYLGITTFLFILEDRPDRAILLPVFGMLWCNLHGVAYPVLLLIIGSYVLEYLLTRTRAGTYDAKRERAFFVPAVLSMLAVYLTPHGGKLLTVPFLPLQYMFQHIKEFSLVTTPFALDTLSLQITRLIPSYLTMLNIVLVASTLAVLMSLVTRRPRISHLALWVGGLILLAQGGRFLYEFTLLSLPVLRANPLVVARPSARRIPRLVSVVLSGLLMAMPVRYLNHFFGYRHRYPLSAENLPSGVVTFLQRVGTGGRVFNSPTAGGYLRWGLYPQYTIFMDLEVPFLFIPEDLYHAINTFASGGYLLKQVLGQYDPDWIIAPLAAEAFHATMEELPAFVPVFFDDHHMIYLNQRQHPTIASRYALEGFHPAAFRLNELQPLIEQRDELPWLRHLSTLLAIDPDCGVTNWLAAMALQRDGGPDRALPYAEALVRDFPGEADGYWLLGDSWSQLGKPDKALRYYARALKKRLNEGEREDIYKKISAVYQAQHQYQRAYQSLKKALAVQLFSVTTSVDELFILSMLASQGGKREDFLAISRYVIQYKMNPEESHWKEHVKEMLGLAGPD